MLPISLFGQIDDIRYHQYYPGFTFNEGVYKQLNDFQNNKPSYDKKIEKRGESLYIEDDSTFEMILVDPNKIWGFCLGNNIYISYDEAYWRVINVGTLCHFTAILVSTFQTVDAYGFPITQYSKSLQHLFLDSRDGEVYALKEKHLKPFLDEEPILAHKFESKRRKKLIDLIQALKAYNELTPIEFPVYE